MDYRRGVGSAGALRASRRGGGRLPGGASVSLTACTISPDPADGEGFGAVLAPPCSGKYLTVVTVDLCCTNSDPFGSFTDMSSDCSTFECSGSPVRRSRMQVPIDCPPR